MRLALQEAWRYQGLTYPNPAVGCCVVGKNNELLACNAHKKAGASHAEVEALKDAYFALSGDSAILLLNDAHAIHTYLLAHHNGIFRDISLYTTLEPCSHIGKTPSCASLISALGIKKIYVGSNDTNEIAANGNELVRKSGAEVTEGVLQKECDALLAPFVAWNQRGHFVFFKWAQRLDGSVDGGVISSQSSRESVHAMRDRCDLLVIGGNTVRTDRPTLDARMVTGKAPDVLIFSRSSDFDRTIPLFGVEGRKVYIENTLKKINEYHNVMIEGGAKMFEATKEVVDYYLCYLAPSMGGSQSLGLQKENFEILNLQKDAQDIIMWMKRKQ
ncbi:MAG: bifunctional diaminohydroxyphosphoribosylaminopyrimidine deaminase/5-amino-6-(5-phosphoribosylamino)uracil reductase RibD [Sulfurimonadaceae bacterium]